ncbi:DUF6575 domain-containing protein [Pseudomonas sp. GCM10022188]|uniref:DUF6575 domain-containing protein n=1 Tax=Pseudomonas TaxID=286 RepID=UPI001E5975B9|nr:DUF6575 domain-containing protein [Pseudomonas oryzagri]MCC6075773.1 hypothetical protein [Pseudomonas oryzagri]
MFNLPQRTALGELSITNVFEYFDVLRLFSCKNRSGGQYLALSVFDDYEVFEWVYLPISTGRLSLLVSKLMDLREAYTSPEDGYLFKVSSRLSGESSVEYIFPEQLLDDDLPSEGAYLESPEEVKLGFGAVDASEAAISSRRETYNLHLYPTDTRLPELEIRGLGAVLVSFQDLVDSIGQYCSGEPTVRGPIPAGILEAVKFKATQVFEGSFGIQLKSAGVSDLFDNSLASDVLLELTNLLDVRDNADFLSNKLHAFKGRVSSKYRAFLREITKLNSPINIQWGSPNPGRGSTLSISRQELRRAFEIVNQIDIDMSESIAFRAELLGLDVQTKRYRVRSSVDGESYSGRISDDSVGKVSHSKINGIYDVVLKRLVETNSSSGAEVVKWVLVSLQAVEE